MHATNCADGLLMMRSDEQAMGPPSKDCISKLTKMIHPRVMMDIIRKNMYPKRVISKFFASNNY